VRHNALQRALRDLDRVSLQERLTVKPPGRVARDGDLAAPPLREDLGILQGTGVKLRDLSKPGAANAASIALLSSWNVSHVPMPEYPDVKVTVSLYTLALSGPLRKRAKSVNENPFSARSACSINRR
jgi:hypothetical protein